MEEKFDRLWRDYSEEHVRLLSAVAVLRRASFRVDEIGELLAAPAPGADSGPARPDDAASPWVCHGRSKRQNGLSAY